MKPYGYMNVYADGRKEFHYGIDNASVSNIPLYTAPKELSDEEIKAIANNLTCTPDKNWNVLFAREILKKASEK
jgi:hypothetical protein